MSILRQEIQLLKARIASHKQQIEELKIRGDNNVILVRQKTDPFYELNEIDTRGALAALNELNKIRNDYMRLKSELDEMEKDLGVQNG